MDAIVRKAARGSVFRTLGALHLDCVEQRVRRGAGLVIFTGPNVRTSDYNRLLHREGEGVLPVELGAPGGDLTKQRWVGMTRELSGHPAAGALDPELNRHTQFFVWNRLLIPQARLEAGDVRVLARVDDADRSPLIVESRFGEGRVVLVATDPGGDWSNWPDMLTFPIFMQEIGRYVARVPDQHLNVAVGEALVQQIDLAAFRPQVRLRPPRGDFIRRTAATDEQTGRTQVRFGDPDEGEDRARTGLVGFYTLELTRRPEDRDGDGQDRSTRNVIFAANIEPEEGDLTRADTDALQRQLGESGVRFVDGEVADAGALGGGRQELRNLLLAVLLTVLAAELLLGWWFGRRR